ncbi:MAG: hypothetical protein PHD97_06020 [Bacteroidales bacterium]|nr:hypothetical protein [Bacteroidales bacterium]
MKKYTCKILLATSILLINFSITFGQDNQDDANVWLNLGGGRSFISKNNGNKSLGIQLDFAVNCCYNKNYFKLSWLIHTESFFFPDGNETDLGKFSFLYGKRIYKGFYIYSGISHFKGYMSFGNYERSRVSSFGIPLECEIIFCQNKHVGFGCNVFSDFVINKFSMYGFGFIVRFGNTDK